MLGSFIVLLLRGRRDLFLNFPFQPLTLDVQPQPVVNAHILVSNPDD